MLSLSCKASLVRIRKELWKMYTAIYFQLGSPRKRFGKNLNQLEKEMMQMVKKGQISHFKIFKGEDKVFDLRQWTIALYKEMLGVA